VPDVRGLSLRQAVHALCAESSPSLGFEPRVDFDGAVDSSVESSVAEQVLAVLQEALSNVTRHAAASRVDVSVATTGGELVVTITDDGRGLTETMSGGRGLENIRARAKRLGGEAAWEAPPTGGTTLRWRVPLK
jgi:signal transduction histidine kinase